MHNSRVTNRLYYEDPDACDFTATVEQVSQQGHRFVVTLDRTAFYPEGGGQPADCGTLNGHPVVDVQKEDGRISHFVEPTDAAPLFTVGDTVNGHVDPHRRRDFMQQHTGQHIISAALVRVGDYNTVSVHLGEEYTTIEIDKPLLSPAHLNSVEQLANEIIERSVPVESHWVDDKTIGEYPLRRPPKVKGSIRLVTIEGVDCVACGGVHVQNTNKVRLVHAMGTESIRGHVRIYWKIGDRALADYRMTAGVVRALADRLSAQPHEVVERVRLLDDRLKECDAGAKLAKARVHRLTADGLLGGERRSAGMRVITADFTGEDKDFLRGVSAVLADHPDTAACLVNDRDGQLQWSIVLGADTGLDFKNVSTALLPLIEAKGGGKPPIWQGVGANPGGAHRFLQEFRVVTERD